MAMLFSFINALIITKCRVPAIVTTIATNYLFRGLIVVITGGYWVNQFPKAFTRIGAGRLFGISNLFWMAMLLLIVMTVFMKYFNTGRKIYAVGTNPQGADLSGISSDRIQLIGYTICGALIGFAGVMYASIINNGLIQIKVSEYWVDAITGAIILIALVLNVLNAREKRKGDN